MNSEILKIKRDIENVRKGKYHRKITVSKYQTYFRLKGYKNTHLLTLSKAEKLYDLERSKLSEVKKVAKMNNIKLASKSTTPR